MLIPQMYEDTKQFLEAKAHRKKFALKRKPDDFVWFCIKALFIGPVLLVLSFFFLGLLGSLGLSNVVGEAGFNAVAEVVIVIIVIATLAAGAMLIGALPVRKFINFREGGYQLRLKQLFVITAIVALGCAVVGYAVRQASTIGAYEYGSEF